MISLLLVLLIQLITFPVLAQGLKLDSDFDESMEIDLDDDMDFSEIENESMSALEIDDELSKEVGIIEEIPNKRKKKRAKKVSRKKKSKKIGKKRSAKVKASTPFRVGKEERELLELAKLVQNKIPSKEWNEVATKAKVDKYIVQKGDWLWKIAHRLFGSGFYYAKIWALNPHITNPHQIEPGMTLIFTTGDSDSLPEVRLGSFDEKADGAKPPNGQKTQKKI